MGRWRRDDQRLAPIKAALDFGDVAGGRQRHAGFTIIVVEPLDRAVGEDWPNRGIDPGEQPLGFAKRIAKNQAGAAMLLVAPPPRIDVGKHFFLRCPAVDWQPKGRFSNKCVTWHWLERRACRVYPGLVITRCNPDLTTMGYTHLCRAKNVTSRVQRHIDAIDVDLGTIVERTNQRVLAHARA